MCFFKFWACGQQGEKIVVFYGFGIAIVINHEVVICLNAIFADVSLVSAIARKVFDYLLPD